VDETKTADTPSIDRADVYCAFAVGLVAAAMKTVSYVVPHWHLGSSDGLVASLIFLGYIVYRARRQPEKLDAWGLTTPITPGAAFTALLLLAAGVASLTALGHVAAGGIRFEGTYAAHMINYIPGAFPQQFAMCSVFLMNLEKLPVFQGPWRLPVIVGLGFGLAHFWTPYLIPGTFIPVQVILTMPVGFAVAWYFLRFRTILPLILSHAILYVCLNRWVQAYL